MRVVVAIVILVFSLGTWGCGSSDSGGSPVTPTPSQTPAPTSTSVVTINVIGINGAQSFSPNPATLPSGQMVVWHNIDSVTHRVVFNDGSLDTGNLDPGASSQPMTINVPAAGDAYHCSIHPVMVGTIVTAAISTAGS
jgi:plastocyanin